MNVFINEKYFVKSEFYLSIEKKNIVNNEIIIFGSEIAFFTNETDLKIHKFWMYNSNLFNFYCSCDICYYICIIILNVVIGIQYWWNMILLGIKFVLACIIQLILHCTKISYYYGFSHLWYATFPSPHKNLCSLSPCFRRVFLP